MGVVLKESGMGAADEDGVICRKGHPTINIHHSGAGRGRGTGDSAHDRGRPGGAGNGTLAASVPDVHGSHGGSGNLRRLISVGIISPLLALKSCDYSWCLPVDAPTLNSGPCTLQLCI